jgi:hypothetical protein
MRNPWYSFSEAESTSGHMVLSEGTTEKIPSDTTRVVLSNKHFSLISQGGIFYIALKYRTRSIYYKE